MEIRRDIFQAIADSTRRAIIILIALQAMTPSAIAEYFDTTSRIKAFTNFDRAQIDNTKTTRQRNLLST